MALDKEISKYAHDGNGVEYGDPHNSTDLIMEVRTRFVVSFVAKTTKNSSTYRTFEPFFRLNCGAEDQTS